MAKLESPMWLLAISLVAGLATIASQAHPSNDFICGLFSKSKTTKAIEAKHPNERSHDEVLELGKAYIKKLDGRRIWMSSDRLQSLMKRTDDFETNHPSVLKDLGMSDWIGTMLSLWRYGRDCDEKFIQHSSVMLYDLGTKLERKVAFDWFEAFLQQCGYEDSYKKVINRLKQNSPEQWQSNDTLYMILRYLILKSRKVVPTVIMVHNKLIINPNDYELAYERPEKLSGILSAIKGLSEFESNLTEAGCDKMSLWTNMTDWLDGSRGYPILSRVTQDSFALFLDECCFEEMFSKVLVKYGNEREGSNPPLARYLRNTPRVDGPIRKLLKLIRLDPADEPGECKNGPRIGYISDLARTYKSDNIKSKLYYGYSDVLGTILKSIESGEGVRTYPDRGY